MIFRITHLDTDGEGCEHCIEADTKPDAVSHMVEHLFKYPVNIERALVAGLTLWVLSPGDAEPERMTINIQGLVSIGPRPDDGKRVLH
jgi:hypothetical protein